MSRLRVVLEFNQNNMSDLELYARLSKFQNPRMIVKEILKGNLPLSIIMEEQDHGEREKKNSI